MTTLLAAPSTNSSHIYSPFPAHPTTPSAAAVAAAGGSQHVVDRSAKDLFRRDQTQSPTRPPPHPTSLNG